MGPTTIEPGDVLYGYCGGAFGRDSYGDKIVVAMGRDWIVCREKGAPVFAHIDGEGMWRELEKALQQDEDEE